jgi:hypothetical protein
MSQVSDAPGPYGTNQGDIWLAPDSEMQQLLDETGEGLTVIYEVMEIHPSGHLAERFYTTRDPKLIAQARAGYQRYLAARRR